jgi:hypothetical protein
MKKKNDPFEGVFDNLKYKVLPTDEQKAKILHYVLRENRLQDNSITGKIGRWITTYPWRFAFSAATVQAIICTSIFGTRYTNLFLNIFGG